MAKAKRTYLLATWMEFDNTDLPVEIQVEYDAMKACNKQAKVHKEAVETMLAAHPAIQDNAPENSVPVFGHTFGKLTGNFIPASEVKAKTTSATVIKLS
jgi:hypothetical protein